MKNEYVPMICPVCEDFYFSELQEGDQIEDLQCSRCGWKYDLNQVHNPDAEGGPNEISLNEYKRKFVEKLAENPDYDYFEAHRPPAEPHKCPVCGKYEFKDVSSFDICPYCGWEDDGTDDGSELIGANGVSFSEFKRRYEASKKD